MSPTGALTSPTGDIERVRPRSSPAPATPSLRGRPIRFKQHHGDTQGSMKPVPPRPSTAPANLQPAICAAREKIHARFKAMHKAFQHVDLDNNGTIERSEIIRMCDGWGISGVDVDELLRHCDTNGDGVLNYREFVDAFAQDTVQRGVTLWQIGDTRMCAAVTPERVNPAAGVFGLKAPRRFGEPMRPINCAQGIAEQHLVPISDTALLLAMRQRVQQRYTSPRQAFQRIAGNGGISPHEMAGAIKHWNLPAKSAQVRSLMSAFDANNDGLLSYHEFRKGFFV